MDAVDALSEIAFWLERDLAPTFKVQAFRRAATLIGDLDPAELADRMHDGRLRATKGIGGRRRHRSGGLHPQDQPAIPALRA